MVLWDVDLAQSGTFSGISDLSMARIPSCSDTVRDRGLESLETEQPSLGTVCTDAAESDLTETDAVSSAREAIVCDVLNMLTAATGRVEVLIQGDDVHDLGEGIGRDLRVQKTMSALVRKGQSGGTAYSFTYSFGYSLRANTQTNR